MNSPKIRINNKDYDVAASGSAADGAPIDPHKLMQDLILEESTAPKPPVLPPKPKKSPVRISDITRTSKRVDKSQTLMRPAVRKPHIKPAPRNKAEDIPRVLPKNKDRIHRAKSIPKSSLIKRFNHPAVRPVSVRPKLKSLEVKHPTQQIALPALPKRPEDEWPVIDQFEKAMQEASSHLETFVDETVRSKKNRKWAYAVVSLSIVFGVGFGVYHVMPSAQIKLASGKAGFSPSVPGYSPSGFGLAKPVQADPGQVTLSYKSRTDDKGFNITQAPSVWSSQSLIDNFLASSHSDYQTVKGNGRTIYTYDKSDATWVDGGIWYKVEGNASLSDDQLLKIANSL